MSPIQHGEVFVTEDGTETDLDLGHYERFIDENMNHFSNLTTGKVYWNVLQKERKGEYLGQTVQIIPHITDEIKRFIYSVGERAKADIVITEIGGTVGDIESQPFIEAIRQISIELPEEDTCFLHVTLVPFIPGSDEYKSKPTQHSVKELQVSGVRPDIILARCDGHLPDDVKLKISHFCNVRPECVIENTTVDDLYEAPIMLEKQNFSRIVCNKLKIDSTIINLDDWNRMLGRIHSRQRDVTVALVGKYVRLHDAYLSVVEALKHGGYENAAHVRIKWIDSEDVTEENREELFADADGILVPGGFGHRGIEGKILACEYARENDIPYLGLCLGMQIAVIEFARHVLHYEDADSGEFNENSTHKVIDFMPDQYKNIRKGGTLRLGAYPCVIAEGTQMEKWYGQKEIQERHRHRYEFNNDYRKVLTDAGLVLSGRSPDDLIIETVEVPENDFYIGVQYHPEFKSRPTKAHPLFKGLVSTALNKV
jgi:CTP synthase